MSKWGDSMRNTEVSEVFTFRAPKGLMMSVRNVCETDNITLSSFIRASLILGLEVYYYEKTGREIDGKEEVE